MAASTSSGFHTYQSWGRTRCPKNIAGGHTTLLHGGGKALPGAAPAAETDGYSTENQRFLHILLINTDNTKNHTMTVYGFNYAFGVWFPLKDVDGNAVSVNHVNNAVNEYRIYEIAGVDRVYFRDNGNDDFHADDTIAAATSTF
jgi:hypothetical protein